MDLGYSEIGARLSAGEAASLVGAVARQQIEDGVVRGLPPFDRIRLDAMGQVSVGGEIAPVADGDYVRQLAMLLRRLLGLDDPPDAGPGPHAPGAMLLLIARAMGEIDLPAPTSIEFCSALTRFGATDAETLAAIHRRCASIPRQRPDADPTPPSRPRPVTAVTVLWGRAAHGVVVRWPDLDRASAAQRRGQVAVAGALMAASFAVLVLGLLAQTL